MKRGNTKRKNNTIYMLFSLVLGMLLGWICSDFTGNPNISGIISNLGIWIFIAALLAVYSSGAGKAALHTLIFFGGTIIAYMARIYIAGGTVDNGKLINWVILAVIGSLIGIIEWESNNREWYGAACAAVPIALLIAEGYPIYQSRSIALILDMVCALILYILLAQGKNQKLISLIFIIVFSFALVYFDVLSKIGGGLV